MVRENIPDPEPCPPAFWKTRGWWAGVGTITTLLVVGVIAASFLWQAYQGHQDSLESERTHEAAMTAPVLVTTGTFPAMLGEDVFCEGWWRAIYFIGWNAATAVEPYTFPDLERHQTLVQNCVDSDLRGSVDIPFGESGWPDE